MTFKKRIPLTTFIHLFLLQKRAGKAYKRRYRNLAAHISSFEAKTGTKVRTDNLNESVCEAFIHYLRTDARMKGRAKHGAGLMANSVRNIWEKLQHMQRRAAKRGYKVNLAFEDIKVEGEDACAIYLTLPELKRLNELKGLSRGARAVRDRFLVGCFTALRYGNYSKVSSSDIIKGNFYVKTNKTGKHVVIPVHPVISEILARNGGELPPLPSAQAFGKAIKRVCRKAGITEEVMYERTVGTRVVKKRVKKYAMVSSHTARRTAATNMYLSGIPAARIMMLTGHTTEQTFFRYIRIDREENAKTLSEQPFFQIL